MTTRTRTKPRIAIPPVQARLLAAALAAAHRGWHVFPLRPNDKRPAIPSHSEADCDRSDPWCRDGHRGWEARATTDEARIRRAWTQAPYNVGIACGPSGLLVLDLDTAKDDLEPSLPRSGVEVLTALAAEAGEQLPDTYTVQTGRGGAHLYYRQPADGPQLANTAGHLGRLIDTRGHGGYVVAAGSIVAGHPYLTSNRSEPVPLPDWLTTRLTPPPPTQTAPLVIGSGREGAYLHAAITAELDRIRAAGEGCRNHTLFRAAAALGQLVAGGCLTDSDVTANLTQAALAGGLTARETARTIASGLRTGSHHPRTPSGA